MLGKNSERGSSDYYFFTFLIMLVVLVVVVGLVTSCIVDMRKTSLFDQKYQEGDIKITANYIALGGTGNPGFSEVPEWTPVTVSFDANQPPRLMSIKDCISLDLPKGTQGLYAATEFPSPELIGIYLPQRDTGSVNICVPEGAEIDLVMWVK